MEYSLDIERILEDPQDQWAAIGPDFVQRLGPQDRKTPGNVVAMPLRKGAVVAAPELSPGTEWALAKGILHAEDPAIYQTWFAGLVRLRRDGARLVLAEPSRFHGSYVQTHLAGWLLAACRSVDGDVGEVVVTA